MHELLHAGVCRQSILYVLRALDKLIISINGCFLHLCHVTCAYVLYYFASFKGVNQELFSPLQAVPYGTINQSDVNQ